MDALAPEKNKSLEQFFRFAIVGASGIVVDLGVLNALAYFFGIYAGGGAVIISSVSFSVAVINNYFLNKYWTFKSAHAPVVGEFVFFFLVSVGGLIFNTGAVFVMTGYFSAPYGISALLWLNLAKVAGIGTGFFWNFFGSKILVFGRQTQQ